MRPSLKKVIQRGGGGSGGKRFYVEDSTYKGPESIQVTEHKVHAKKGRKSRQPIDWSWRKHMVRGGI